MGPKKFQTSQAKETAEGAIGGEESTEVEIGTFSQDASLQELKDIFQAHIAMQKARDDGMEQSADRQEARWKSLQHQFGLLQQEVHARTTPVLNPGLSGSHDDLASHLSIQQTSQVSQPSSGSRLPAASPVLHQYVYPGSGPPAIQKEPHLQQLSDLDDIEHYLTTFERIAVACRWPMTDWAVRLVPLLTGKARSAYVHMDMTESLDYEKVKAAILDKYDINSESYRLQFRSSDVGRDETPKELYV